MKAADDREARLTTLLQNQNTQPSSTAKQISVERPVLLSSATLSDLTAWEEAWDDYARCQKLASQDTQTQVSAVRQALNEDLRRYLREGVIPVALNADVTAVIAAIKKYIRRQRNPLLDRIDFYNRRQHKGESFDSFFTCLKELFSACDFVELRVCRTCSGRMCTDCPKILVTANEELLRDRIVVGVLDDDTRHKLLSEQNLTLSSAAKICRAEEAAKQTNDGMPTTGSFKAAVAKKSSYQKQKSQFSDRSATAQPPKKCVNCGRSAHTKSSCPAAGKTCNGCKASGHFEKMCPKKSQSAHRNGKIGQLKLQQASSGNQGTVTVHATLNTETTGAPIDWIPDTGSDVDAIGLQHLELLGGFPENLATDYDVVTGVNGQRLESAGQIHSSLAIGAKSYDTTIHVYPDLSDALLSRTSLLALGLLPANWPSISRVEIQPAQDRTADEIRTELLQEFADVFDDGRLKPMSGSPMDIELQADAKPACTHHARPVPFAFRDQIKDQLDGMVKDDIIEPVSTSSEWCHPIVIVDKKGTSEKRLTVDFKKLNDQIQRPAHPMQPPRDVVSSISGRYFTKLDARHGYWQVPLCESARPLTTFITPWGRFRYLRNPQGLISAGDEYNRRTDAAFDGITNFKKVVDDCLVYDDDLSDHVARVRRVLTCARDNGIKLSAKKFVFAATQIEFCGYRLNADGWTVDEAKTSAIRDFSTPSNRTDLRSFLGLMNQCAEFTPCLAELSAPLRGLLKPSTEFLWHHDHTAAFNAIKDELVSLATLSYFQVGSELRLETDASKLKGLGFVLWQKQDTGWRIIQCGSRYLSDTESRYAVIELELLAIVWAVKKCKLFLSGTQFRVITDHRSLVPIINAYSLDQIENPRLLRMMLKLQSFQLCAEWRKGADNAFADALSRNPVDLPSPTDQYGEAPALANLGIRACLRRDEDGLITDLRFQAVHDAAAADSDYQLLLQHVQDGFPNDQRDLPDALRSFWNGREHLSVANGIVLKGQRIVVPVSLRQHVLQDLHASHQGIVRTKARARQVVYWPKLSQDLETLIRACPTCRERQASLPREPLLNDRHPTLPFEHTSADLFTCQGREFLVYVDRLSGWPCLAPTGTTTSSHDVIVHLRRWFPDVGVPSVLCTDGGPQFASHQFAEFCRRWQISHVMSTPHFPQSNGHAEAGVKAMKTLVHKTTTNGRLDVDAFQRGLLEWRNTPRSDGISPAQKLYGRPLSSFVLAHHRSFSSEWQTLADDTDAAPPSAPAQFDVSARPLSELRIGTHVDVQDPRSKLWCKRGVIVGVGRHRDYYVKLTSGRVYWRNRRFLRPFIPLVPATPDGTVPANPPADQPAPVAPRRSTRNRRATDRLDISSTKGQSYV